MISKWFKLVRTTLLLAGLVYVLVCTYMWATQRHFIFEPRPQFQTTPERLGLKFEEVHIPSGSNTEHGDLYAWWLPADQADAPTLLYLHGNDKNIGHAHDMDTAARLHGMGYNLLAVDYRGYGKSSGGEPSETKVYEDAEAAWNYLIKQRTCDPKRTFIYGHSLGGAIAIDLAAHHADAAGIIAESTFTTMADMGRREYPYLPVDLFLNQHFDSLHKIADLKVPLLLIHGTWDRRIPYQMSEQLFESAQQPKSLKLIEGGDHSNCALIAPLEYRAAVSGFIQQHTARHG